MPDLPVSAESSATPTAEHGDLPGNAGLGTAVEAAGSAYAAAAENAQRIALAFREQVAQQEGNTVQ